MEIGDWAVLKVAADCAAMAKGSYDPVPVAGTSICIACWLLTLMLNRLFAPNDRATQFDTIVAGTACILGIFTVYVRLSGLPPLLENSSPYHCRPLLRKFTVSSS